jgi:hypothetical protein
MTSPHAAAPPEFDPDDPVWADLLWSAVNRRDETAIAALADYGRHHSAEPVLLWLEGGPAGHRWLAGRLLVEGVPADASHVGSFLASLRHAVRRSRPEAAALLDLAARLDDPSVRASLTEAVRDRALWGMWGPGPMIARALAAHAPAAVPTTLKELIAHPEAGAAARVSAAGALARLDARYTAEAIGTVRAAIDAETDATVRDLAERVLAELVPSSADEAAKVIRAELRRTRRPTPSYHVEVARRLAWLGPRYTAEAVSMLRHLPPDLDGDGDARAFAAQVLIEVGSQYTDEAIAELRDVMADLRTDPHERIRAAEALAGLGPRHVDEAVEAVRAMIRLHRDDAHGQVVAAKALAGLGPEHMTEAGRTLRAILARPDAGASARASAATTLAGLGPPHLAEAAEALRSMIADPAVEPFLQLSAARALADVGPRYAAEAVDALQQVLARPHLDAHVRVFCANNLAELAPEHTAAIREALRMVIADSGTSPQALINGLESLARRHPGYETEVAEALRAVIDHPAVRPWDRVHAATYVLARLGPEHTAKAAEVVRGVIADPTTGPRAQVAAAAGLAGLGSQFAAEAVEALRAVIARPDAAFTDRSDAARLAARLDPGGAGVQVE